MFEVREEFNLIVGSLLMLICYGVVGNEVRDFMSPPTTIKARENNTVLLPCYMNTLSNDAVQAKAVRWYKDKILFADSSDETQFPPARYMLWLNGSLEIERVQPSDTGEYICEIERPLPWGPIKQTHAIEVLHRPSVSAYPPTGFVEVTLGDEVKMSCKGEGVPHPMITWSRKNGNLQLIDHREILKFKATHRNLAGIYECVATNGVGDPAKAEIELNIIYPPEVSAAKAWVHTAPAHRAQLECTVSADPPASVTWLKEETPVTVYNRVLTMVQGEKYTLVIRNVQPSDFGVYTCRARNSLGQGDVHIQLSGVPKPAVFKKTDDKNLNAKNSYTLIWEVDSYTPIIEYILWFRRYASRSTLGNQKWMKLIVPTEHSSGPVYSKSYTLNGLREKTVYEALLVSRNKFGWSKPSGIFIFATAEAEMDEDIITTVQLNIEENILPLDLTSSSCRLYISIYSFLSYILYFNI